MKTKKRRKKRIDSDDHVALRALLGCGLVGRNGRLDPSPWKVGREIVGQQMRLLPLLVPAERKGEGRERERKREGEKRLEWGLKNRFRII